MDVCTVKKFDSSDIDGIKANPSLFITESTAVQSASNRNAVYQDINSDIGKVTAGPPIIRVDPIGEIADSHEKYDEADIPVSAQEIVESCDPDVVHSVCPDNLDHLKTKSFSFESASDISLKTGLTIQLNEILTNKSDVQTSSITDKLSSEEGKLDISQFSGMGIDTVLQMLGHRASSIPGVKIINKAKPVVKTLKFPPCLVCGGKASGLHYGVNSCEACKGFFRRYLLRTDDYKCLKGGNCEIINRNRGNCSGCRLRKCLLLGMSKEKSQLGRYTLSRRTQTIKEVNKLEGKEETDSVTEGNERYPVRNMDETGQLLENAEQEEDGTFDPNKEMISRKLNCETKIHPTQVSCSEVLVENLVKAMDEIKPYGLSITTEEQLQNALKYHYERYKMKVKMYGETKVIPKEEFRCWYKGFGIDVDGRMNNLRESAKEVEGMIERYCIFAKNLPYFLQLSCKDQSNLLKASRCDFFMILMSEGYSEEFQVFISHNGCAYHIEEAADKFFSRKLITTVCDMYRRWQLLYLSKAEKALLIALTLVFTDRCNLENHTLVEKIQLYLTELLQSQLEKTCKSSAKKRFAKIISYLTLMRESSEMYLKEYKELCKDEMVIEEVPMMTEFLLDDW